MTNTSTIQHLPIWHQCHIHINDGVPQSSIGLFRYTVLQARWGRCCRTSCYSSFSIIFFSIIIYYVFLQVETLFDPSNLLITSIVRHSINNNIYNTYLQKLMHECYNYNKTRNKMGLSFHASITGVICFCNQFCWLMILMLSISDCVYVLFYFIDIFVHMI